MSDDPNTPDPNAAAGATPPAGGTSTPAAAPAAKTFSQEEVNQLVGRARDEGRQAALKKAPEVTEPKKETPAAAGAQAPDVGALVKQALADLGMDPLAVQARAAGLNDAQIQLARAAKPSDADFGQWLPGWLTQVGITIKQGNGTATPTATASQGAAPRKVEDMRDSSGLVDVFALSAEQVLAMGPTKLREEFEKTLSVARERSGAPPLPSALRRKQ